MSFQWQKYPSFLDHIILLPDWHVCQQTEHHFDHKRANHERKAWRELTVAHNLLVYLFHFGKRPGTRNVQNSAAGFCVQRGRFQIQHEHWFIVQEIWNRVTSTTSVIQPQQTSVKIWKRLNSHTSLRLHSSVFLLLPFQSPSEKIHTPSAPPNISSFSSLPFPSRNLQFKIHIQGLFLW